MAFLKSLLLVAPFLCAVVIASEDTKNAMYRNSVRESPLHHFLARRREMCGVYEVCVSSLGACSSYGVPCSEPETRCCASRGSYCCARTLNTLDSIHHQNYNSDDITTETKSTPASDES